MAYRELIEKTVTDAVLSVEQQYPAKSALEILMALSMEIEKRIEQERS